MDLLGHVSVIDEQRSECVKMAEMMTEAIT